MNNLDSFLISDIIDKTPIETVNIRVIPSFTGQKSYVMAVRTILSHVTLGVSFVIKNWPKLYLDKIINKYSKFGLN